MIRNGFRSAAAVFAMLSALGFATSAQAQGTTLNVSSTFSGTFGSSHMDTNGDGQTANTQRIVLETASPLGRSTLEALDESVIAGEGVCENGAPGLLFVQLVTPNTPAAFIQRFNQSGDLLYMTETAGTGCFDPMTNQVFFQASGTIDGGTGRFARASGSFSMRGTGQFLFFNNIDTFGGQEGTFEQTIILPE